MAKERNELDSDDPIKRFQALIARLIARRHITDRERNSTQITSEQRKTEQNRKR